MGAAGVAGMLVLAAVAAAPLAHAARETPRCYGAAARDPRKPCENPRLRSAVHPTPAEAQLTPNSPCARTVVTAEVHPCRFGVAPADARTTVALIGDSHASHWRAALDPVARNRHWAGVSITNGVCAVSAAIKRLPPAGRRRCARWRRGVLSWLRAHPEVTIVFHAQITSRFGVLTRPGQSDFDAKVAGYRRIWRAMPAGVAHIVVIRDNPTMPTGTPECVMRAHAAHQPPGLRCAVRRAERLRRSPAAAAVARSRSRRVQLADMTHFFCSTRLCFPVVGGVLVNKDNSHITRAYATTLAPFLLRRVRHLMARW